MPERGLVFSVARLTIELTSPLTIGTGSGDDTRDSICVTDANGLPAIPSTSLAGVLRHALADGADPDRHDLCRAVFGYQAGNRGRASRLEVSWGQVHDSQDRPVPFRGANLNDKVLAFIAAGVLRDHVRLDGRGTAADAGKYDQGLVPTGARFTFELVLHEGSGTTMEKIVGLLASRRVRLGGRTRGGHGTFEVVSAAGLDLDLRRPEHRETWRRLPRDLSEPPERELLRTIDLAPPEHRRWLDLDLSLHPRDYWIFGGGTPHREEHRRPEKGKRTDKFHDRVPFTERRVEWPAAGLGRVTEEPQHVVPASAIKGALRHRVAYHARCLAGDWQATEPDEAYPWPDQDLLAPPRKDRLPEASPTEVEEWLFGSVKDSDDESGSPGRIFIEDARVDTVQYADLDHVSLDRFTQGPMDGLLFGEAALFKGAPLALRIGISLADGPSKAPPHTREALRRALADLLEGRLPLGAGGSKGHGVFEGRTESLAKLDALEER